MTTTVDDSTFNNVIGVLVNLSRASVDDVVMQISIDMSTLTDTLLNMAPGSLITGFVDVDNIMNNWLSDQL